MAAAGIASPFVFFLHIPKTAGTTLRSIVDAQYGKKAVAVYYNQGNRQLLDNLPYFLKDRGSSLRALIGHFPFGVHEGLTVPYSYVTFLRDPVLRSASAYLEILKTDQPRVQDTDGSLLSLEEVVERDLEFQDCQIRMLTALQSNADVDERIAMLAEKNLEHHFSFVGTMERFDESLLLLSKALGWRPCVWGRLNPGPAERNFEPSALAKLASRNALDAALYERVDNALTNSIEAHGALFKDALDEIKAAIDRRTKVGKSAAAAELVSDDELPRVAAYLRS